MADGTLKFDTSIDTEGASSGLSKMGEVAKNALSVFTGNLMTKATEAIVNLGKEALNSGMSFETGMAKVSTLFSGTDEELQGLSNTILSISSATGLAADTLTEAAYSAESAGVAQEDLASMLQNSAQLATAGFTDIDTALSATAKTMNAYGMAGEDAIGKVQKVLIQTQNYGITTVGELGASLAQVTPTAAAFGVSFENVGAALAVMTAAGTPTAQATTQLNSVIAELGKSGTIASKNLTKAAEGTKYAGMSFKEMMDSGADLSEVMGMIDAQAKKDGVSMVDMFSSIEAGKAAMSIFSGEGETFTRNLQEMSTETDVVSDAYGTMADTLENKTARIKSSFSNMAISIFQQAAGPLADGAEQVAGALAAITEGFNENGLQGMLDAFSGVWEDLYDQFFDIDWEGAAEKITNSVTSFLENGGANQIVGVIADIFRMVFKAASELAPALIPAVAQLMVGFANAILDNIPGLIRMGMEAVEGLAQGIIEAIPILLNALPEIFTRVAEELTVLLPQITNVVLSLITSLIELFSNMDLAPIISAAIEIILALNQGFLDALPQLLPAIIQLVIAITEGLLENLPAIIEAGIQLIVALAEGIIEALPEIVAALVQVGEALWEHLQKLPGYIWECLQTLWDNIGPWFTELWNLIWPKIQEVFEGIGQWLSELPGRVWQWLLETLYKVAYWGTRMIIEAPGAIKNMIDKMITFMKELPGKIWTWLKNTITKVLNFGKQVKDEAPKIAKTFTEKLVDGLKDLPKKMLEIGENIVTGIWDGISGAWSWLTGKVSEIAGALTGGIKDALGIHSPSKVFAQQVGRWIPPGISDGMERAMPDALADMRARASEMVAGMKSAVNANIGDFSVKSSGQFALAGTGTTVYNDYHTEQENTYNVPVASPSEVAKSQREALRKMVGGVK